MLLLLRPENRSDRETRLSSSFSRFCFNFLFYFFLLFTVLNIYAPDASDLVLFFLFPFEDVHSPLDSLVLLFIAVPVCDGLLLRDKVVVSPSQGGILRLVRILTAKSQHET